MIYILTPFRRDFIISCEMKGFPPEHPNVKWINSWEQLIGRKIFKTDEVRYGVQFSSFPEKEIERFKIELALRTEK